MSNGRMEEAKALRGRHFELHKHQIFTSTFNGKLDKITMIACTWFMKTAAAPSAFTWKQQLQYYSIFIVTLPSGDEGFVLTYPSQIRKAVRKSKAVPSFRSTESWVSLRRRSSSIYMKLKGPHGSENYNNRTTWAYTRMVVASKTRPRHQYERRLSERQDTRFDRPINEKRSLKYEPFTPP